MELLELELERDANPLDRVEEVASFNDWAFERDGDDEISIAITGTWAEYSVSFSWMEDFEALHLGCAFDLKIPAEREVEAMKLLSKINGQLLIGHFDIWHNEGMVMFRQVLMLNGGMEPNGSQLECLLASALEACEQYYQAFQVVVWGNHDAATALECALFETHGTA